MSHRPNLSINSINSIIEPTTPPAAPASRLNLWEEKTPSATSAAPNNLLLPTFNLDLASSYNKNFGTNGLATSATGSTGFSPSLLHPTKIDKEYLLSINKVPLTQLRPQILSLAKDQYGCRFLQKKIDEHVVSNAQQRRANFDVIFSQVSPNMYELIIDPFGNYLVQKLIAYCSEQNITLILESLLYNLFQISINQHGTRALQKIIDAVSNKYQLTLIVNGLSPYIIELIKDLNGNHVIQKILNKYPADDCQFIYDSIIKDLLVVATHKHGCCVLQKCLNHVTTEQLSQFSARILTFEIFIKLINDQFGNYVLQYLISINSLPINRAVFNNFVRFGVSNLCKLKFSSNVVEKFLKNCFNNEPISDAFSCLKYDLCYQILISDLNKMINDPYGNYVVQTLIEVIVNANFKEPLMENVMVLLPLNYRQNMEPLQIQIIKKWFQNCKIVSSFGKRIQLKINVILNGSGLLRSSTSVSTNMNSDGEFIVNPDTFVPQSSRRSNSFNNSQNAQMPYVHHQRGCLYPQMVSQPQLNQPGFMQRPLYNSTNRYVAHNPEYILGEPYQDEGMLKPSLKYDAAQNISRFSGMQISNDTPFVGTTYYKPNSNQYQSAVQHGAQQWYVEK